jgi:hypothetical protein
LTFVQFRAFAVFSVNEFHKHKSIFSESTKNGKGHTLVFKVNTIFIS